MHQLINQLWNSVTSSSNQFLSGGLALGIIGSLGYWLKSLPNRMWHWFLFHFTVVLEVTNTDQAYHWLLLWAESQPYTKKARRIALRDVKSQTGYDKSALVPARGSHWFIYKKLPIWFSRGKDDSATPSSIQGGPNSLTAPREILAIRTLGRNRNRVNGIIAEAKALYEGATADKLIVHYRRWGEWEVRTKRKRPLESVIVDNKDALVKDMQRFLEGEDWYAQMGLPYRRGYLFHGIAGTGKTSLVEALASTLNLPIYIINLASVDDSQLEHTIAEMEHTSPVILLLEDVDTVAPPRESETPADKDKVIMVQQPSAKLRLGTLLNVLDGLTATDKILLVMTTNHADKLDPALKRRGRADVSVDFTYATETQIAQAIERFLVTPSYEQLSAIAAWPRPITMCDVQENLRQMVWDRAAVAEALEDKAA